MHTLLHQTGYDRASQKKMCTHTKNNPNFCVVVKKCTGHEATDCVIQNCNTLHIYILKKTCHTTYMNSL